MEEEKAFKHGNFTLTQQSKVSNFVMTAVGCFIKNKPFVTFAFESPLKKAILVLTFEWRILGSNASEWPSLGAKRIFLSIISASKESPILSHLNRFQPSWTNFNQFFSLF